MAVTYLKQTAVQTVTMVERIKCYYKINNEIFMGYSQTCTISVIDIIMTTEQTSQVRSSFNLLVGP